MDIWLHNPIADMYGPHFLILYGFVIATTLTACWLLMRDSTAKQPLPLIPAEPDPYQIAYLRGGETEVMKLTVFNLIQRGYLRVSEQFISQASNHPDLNYLTPVERKLFDWFSSWRKVIEITSLSFLPDSIKQNWAVYQQQLQEKRLLYGKEWRAWNIRVGLIGIAIIFSLGSYKLLIALGKGHHNVGYLIKMGIFSILILLWMISQTPSRLSQRGQGYLRRLQQAFEQLKRKANTGIASVLDYDLLVALFGVEVLAGTAYDFYRKALLPPSLKVVSTASSRNSNQRTSNRSSSSSCSSTSCSSTSDSSSCSSTSCSSASNSSSCGSSCGGGGGGGCGGGD